MAKPPTTEDFPLRPLGEGETPFQVFRSEAEPDAAEDERGEASAARSPTPPRPPRGRRGGAPSLQRRLYEAEGRPVRLGAYDVLRCVGAGGMGVVYEAVSVEHGQRVALKTLRWMTAQGLARFKNEFRSLRGVAHPNLVALYELGAEQGEWFFTMELVEGQSFREHVQTDGGRPLGGWQYLGETLDEVSVAGGDDDAAPGDGGLGARRTFHEGHLRAALRQLASGVARLHERGLLHRDLNPGNVLVTREGRVVVLDFGLICERVRGPGVAYDGASGTPAYMSPEQASGKPPTPASDWYGLGVMLFEALTGQLPFAGSTLRMLTNKRHHEAPPPSAILPGLPPDLDELCAALLRRDPGDRPSGDEVLRALGVKPRRARVPASSEACFVGRRAELAVLDDALADAARGGGAAVVIQGPAGIGKSSLMARFAGGLDPGPGRPAPLVIRGACSERETIPFRLLDAAVDSLAGHLASLPPSELRAALPPDVRELARAFPVLEGLEAAGEPSPEPLPDGDEREPLDEEAAFARLRDLLCRLGATRPVVLVIDDAHLGGDDHGSSSPMRPWRDGPSRLAELAAVPGLLLVLAHADGEPAAAAIHAALSRALPAGRARFIALGPLGPDDAQALSRAALPEDLSGRPALVAAIAAVSGGSPLSIEELALHVADAGGEVSLDDAVGARLAGLSEPALRIAEAVAAAPGPVPRAVLFAVAGAGASGGAALAILSAGRVVRAAGVRGGDLVRVHDERVRAAIVARTPAAVTRQIQLELLRAADVYDSRRPSG